jgi:hypothetical protein
MYPQVIIDPDEVIRFVSQLKAFNDLLEQHTDKLNKQFKNLGETWRDQEYKKFGYEFETTMKAIKRFTDISKGYGPHLLKKVKPIIKDYQSR